MSQREYALRQFLERLNQNQHIEQVLREQQRILITLLDNLPGMVYRCRNDPGWTMEFVSDGCLELTGYPVDDLVDSRVVSYASLIHPADRAEVYKQVEAAVGQRQPFRLTYRIRTAAGEERWVFEQGRGVFANHFQRGADSVATFNWSVGTPEVCRIVGSDIGPSSHQAAYQLKR